MANSKALRYVLMRAKAEAAKARCNAAQIEHVYLAILHMSHMSADKIAPSSSSHAAIDAEIGRVNDALASSGLDAAQAEAALRKLLTPDAFADCGGEAVEQLLSLAQQHIAPNDELSADAVLRAILSSPTPLIEQANDSARHAYDADDGDDETLPFIEPKRKSDSFKQEVEQDAASNAPMQEQAKPDTDDAPSASEPTGAQTADEKQDGKEQGESGTIAGFVMPKMPDPSEFDPSAVNIGLDESAVRPSDIDPIFDIDDDWDDDEREKPETPPAESGRGGRKPVDFSAIMRELREKRERGERYDSEPDDESDDKPDDEPAPPKPGERKPVDFAEIMRELREKRERGERYDDEPDDEPDDKPDDEPAPPKPGERKPIDFSEIMRELREKRERGEAGARDDEPDSEPDDASDGKPDGEPDDGSDDGIDLGQIMRELREKRLRGVRGASDDESDDEPIKPAETDGKRKKRTKLNGITFRGGTAWAAVQYFLLVVGAAFIVLLINEDVYARAGWYDARAHLLVVSSVLFLTLYFLLRGVTALIKRKREAFGLFLNCVLALITISCLTDLAIDTFVAYETSGWIMALKIVTIFAMALVIGYHDVKINALPNRRSVQATCRVGWSRMKGSPDKIYFRGLLELLLIPLVISGIYWTRSTEPPSLFLVLYGMLGWYALQNLPRCVAKWYPEDDDDCSSVELRKKYTAATWATLLALLVVPWLLVSLLIVYQWSPTPVWWIIALSAYGALYIFMAIAAIAAARIKVKRG